MNAVKMYYPEKPCGLRQQKLPGICLVVIKLIIKLKKTPSPMAQDIAETAVGLVMKQDPIIIIELKCLVCGKKTGCNECEYLTDCEQRAVSKYCICRDCSKQEESFDNCKQSFAAKVMKYLK
jgi:hypothetical protein